MKVDHWSSKSSKKEWGGSAGSEGWPEHKPATGPTASSAPSSSSAPTWMDSGGWKLIPNSWEPDTKAKKVDEWAWSSSKSSKSKWGGWTASGLKDYKGWPTSEPTASSAPSSSSAPTWMDGGGWDWKLMPSKWGSKSWDAKGKKIDHWSSKSSKSKWGGWKEPIDHKGWPTTAHTASSTPSSSSAPTWMDGGGWKYEPYPASPWWGSKSSKSSKSKGGGGWYHTSAWEPADHKGWPTSSPTVSSAPSSSSAPSWSGGHKPTWWGWSSKSSGWSCKSSKSGWYHTSAWGPVSKVTWPTVQHTIIATTTTSPPPEPVITGLPSVAWLNDDVFETPMDTPIMIAPLANDNDIPDGEQMEPTYTFFLFNIPHFIDRCH